MVAARFYSLCALVLGKQQRHPEHNDQPAAPNVIKLRAPGCQSDRNRTHKRPIPPSSVIARYRLVTLSQPRCS
jgi:hypothetical protein